ncbi:MULTISPECIES: DUF3046 domain-containing protein [Microbacterium]|uniref:DUF3046 domain-containing protein n=1 Tax=Microbacterium TaxID=33882 RepID=UPI0012B9005F|nr:MULTISPECIES: DUF3046 domain-containing protein [Microbacterium]MTE23151.1 DUF3046 domain-containing protein [Microbacterium sp. ZXX196]NHI16456.1 DUF3046 domain-containing protein [Microbacterium excoecariae]
MRRSEFLRAVDDHFGARASWILADLTLPAIGRTAADALDEGVPPRDIWRALCDEMDLPAQARYGAGLRAPRDA